MFTGDGSLPEAPDITIMPNHPRKPRSPDPIIRSPMQEPLAAKPSSIEGASWDPTTKNGVYLHVVHGPPESRTAAGWMMAGREAITRVSEERDYRVKSRLFADACYFFNAARWLREKSGAEKGRIFYLLENMKYSKEREGTA